MLSLARRTPENKRRFAVLLAVLLLHVTAIGALLAVHESKTPVVVVTFPSFVPPGPGGTPGGGENGGGTHETPVATPKKIAKAAATPEFATPQPIASETSTELAEASPAPTDAAVVPGGIGIDGTGLPGNKGPGTGGGGDGSCPDCPPVIEVGGPGGLIPMPEEIVHDPPPYPAPARALGLTGRVVLTIYVDPDGNVQSATLVSGSRVFADPALATVRKWKYKALLISGRPAAWRATIRLEFQLQ